MSSDREDRLQFYAGSAHKAPGKGAGECLGSGHQRYADLAAMVGWRQVLSNFYVLQEPLLVVLPEYGTVHVRTVEHGFQAIKLSLASPLAAYGMTIESSSDVGTVGGGKEARAQRKAVLLDAAQLAAWEAAKVGVMWELWRQKFSRPGVPRDVLLATHNAQLWHSAPRMKAERWAELEDLRGLLVAAQSLIDMMQTSN